MESCLAWYKQSSGENSRKVCKSSVHNSLEFSQHHLVFISGYANKTNVFYCFIAPQVPVKHSIITGHWSFSQGTRIYETISCDHGLRFAPCKGIQDSLGFWISHRGFRIPGSWFQYLSLELGFWIPVVSGILDSLSCIPDSKDQDSGFHKQKFLGFWILQAKISQIPESGFPYTGRYVMPIGECLFTLFAH